jgi:signal transduction histidine kinase
MRPHTTCTIGWRGPINMRPMAVYCAARADRWHDRNGDLRMWRANRRSFPRRCVVVFRNLITDAIQATEPGGRIAIVTARAGAELVISVADTGSGIPADRLSRIFDDFVTTKRRGIDGLAISKRIVE